MKHETRKPGTRKGFAALVALVLILCVTIGGTIAWITAQTPAVTNTFTPATVTTDIEENFDGTTKSNITVTNPKTDSSIPVYIRVAVVVGWEKNGQAVYDATCPLPDLTNATKYPLGENWVLHSDGYYYYTKVVDPNESTKPLFMTDITEPQKKPEGARLQVTILAEAIQAQGGAVQNAWPGAPITNS